MGPKAMISKHRLLLVSIFKNEKKKKITQGSRRDQKILEEGDGAGPSSYLKTRS